MKNEKGITLVMLVLTVVLLGILMAFLLKDQPFNKLLQEKENVVQDFNDLINKTNDDIYSIRNQWEDII